MPTPILATKLYIPPLRLGIVLRPRLVDRLNENLAAGHKLSLISASAGSGKTTLVSEWVACCRRPVAWLSLDEGDNEPTRFLAYIIAALQTLTPTFGEGIFITLQSPQAPSIESLVTSLLNEIATLPEQFILVLDDFHAIESKPVEQVLTFLLNNQPPQMHLVIASREDPSLPLARLRVRNQMTELRAADLRFTPAETTEFFNRVLELNLAETEIAALEARTEGWIAGLQLAALSMQGQKDIAGFIQSFTGNHRFVLDYLLEEVLQRQPPAIQDFLLRTSILERLCGPLCDAVLDALPGLGQETLAALERANLFLVPLDNERRWYRYHHLFGDLLRQRLGETLFFPAPPLVEDGSHQTSIGSVVGVRGLHLRASQWYETHDHLDEAFHHTLCANDFKRAARLTEAAWPGMEGSFQSAAWLSWVKKLPERVVRVRPVLCYQLGRAFSDLGEPETSEIHLRNAERALAEIPNQAGFEPLPGNIALTRAYNAQVQGDLVKTIQYAEQAIQLIPAEDVFRRAQAVIMLEFTHWASGDLEASLHAIHAWMADMQTLGNPVFVIASAFAEADLLVVLGRLHEAIGAYRQALQLAAENGPEVQQITAHHHLGLALIYHELGDDESSAAHWQTAADLGQRTTLVDWSHRWELAQARLKESAGEWETALGLLDKAQRVYVKNPVPIAHPVDALKARIHLKQGRRDKAEAWARERGILLTDNASYLDEFKLLILARLHLTDSGVNDLLRRLLALAEAQNRLGSALEILITQALAYRAQGNQPQALAALEHALSLAAPQGYLRTFVDEGEVMRLMMVDFRLKISNSTHPLFGYVNKLLATFLPTAEVNAQSQIADQKSEIFKPLTKRELEVLHLVAQGLSNTEISHRLYLALSTVKGHNQRIFDKLQAQNRTEAIIRARELGLL